MKVARHEMPGKMPNMIRPVGNGMIRSAALFHHTRNDPAYRPIIPYPLGRVSIGHTFQAFHAWLPSHCPSETDSSGNQKNPQNLPDRQNLRMASFPGLLLLGTLN